MTPLERIREIAMALPEVEERLSHGEPTWFIKGKKSFAMFADHHHDDRLACWIAAPSGVQEALVSEQPQCYFRPPYVGVRGWVGAYLDVEVDWQEVEDLLVEGFRHVAPPKLADQLPK